MALHTCPFFGRCGGCKYDFASADYHSTKLGALQKFPITGDAIWFGTGTRRRADFCFAAGRFGFFAAASRDVVAIDACPLCMDEINNIVPMLATLPWAGAGACMVTVCDNGIDIAITSNVPNATSDFRTAIRQLSAIRVSWNNRVIAEAHTPRVSFGDTSVEYPVGAFLQPTIASADKMREMVVVAAAGARRVVDLFCGLGNFTFATHADGFDIAGTGAHRDLFKNPLTRAMLKTYDCVIMDPPRAGADAQCKIIAESDIGRVIYISCNPNTWRRDAETLRRGGYALHQLIPIDQFPGSAHWELFSVFDK